MKERLLQLLEILKMTPTQFSNSVGIQRSTLQHIISGRNEVSLKIVMAIHESYPDFNSDWLLYGKGEPFIGNVPVSAETQDDGYPLFSQVDSDDKSSPDVTDASNVNDNGVNGQNGFVNQEIHTSVKAESDFSNVKGEKEKEITGESVENKTVGSTFIPCVNTKAKNIKEIIVFFDDGTFETFRS